MPTSLHFSNAAPIDYSAGEAGADGIGSAGAMGGADSGSIAAAGAGTDAAATGAAGEAVAAGVPAADTALIALASRGGMAPRKGGKQMLADGGLAGSFGDSMYSYSNPNSLNTFNPPQKAAPPPQKKGMFSNGGMSGANYKSGGHIPGKANVPGDSLKNDTVPIMVSPGEIVIPRSVLSTPDAPAQAAKFVAAVLARQNMRRGSK